MTLKEIANRVLDIWCGKDEEGLNWDIREIAEIVEYDNAVSLVCYGVEWVTIYYSDEEGVDFDAYTINPIKLENVAENRNQLANCIRLLAYLIESCYEIGYCSNIYSLYASE